MHTKNGGMKFLNKLKANPKKIFLIDALGALLTAILLFGILAQLEKYFGMPSNVLYTLSGVAFCLFIYSISCYQLINSNWKPFLKIIIGCNSIYLLVSMACIVLHSDKLTELGWMYFILEFVVIGIMIIVEYKLCSNQAIKN